MEPITILSAAAAVSAVAGKSWELVNWIRELCRGVKPVDERVLRLKSGVNELARACESVHAVLQPGSSSTTLTPPWDKDGSSEKSISRQVSDCWRTLRVLEDFERAEGNFERLAISLQIATIKIALATPDFVIRELREALRDIRKLLDGTEDNKHRPIGHSSTRGDNEDPLIGLAQDALRRGTTLYKASVAGSSVGTDSVMGSERAFSIGRWIHETACTKQNAYAALDDRPRSTPVLGKVPTPTTLFPVEDAIPEASTSYATASDAGSSSWDHSHFESLPATEIKPAPITEPPDLHKPPTGFSKPLDQWSRSDIVARFNIKHDGRFEMMICAGTKVNPKDLLCLKKGKISGKIDAGGERNRNTLALHLAFLFQDLHLVKSLVSVGYSPELSARVSDRRPLRRLRRPIDTAIASHCEPITKLLLMPTGYMSYRAGHKISSCLQLFATTSLNLWPPTDVDAYTRVLSLLVERAFAYVVPYSYHGDVPSRKIPWTVSILCQILHLPEPWTHLRGPLITFALEEHRRRLEESYLYTSCPPLHVTIRIHDAKTLRYLLKTSSAQDLESQLQLADEAKWSLLRHAIEQVKSRPKISLEIVRALLEQGASLDDTFGAPSRILGGFRLRQASIRDIALRSNRAGLKKLVAKY